MTPEESKRLTDNAKAVEERDEMIAEAVEAETKRLQAQVRCLVAATNDQWGEAQWAIYYEYHPQKNPPAFTPGKGE